MHYGQHVLVFRKLGKEKILKELSDFSVKRDLPTGADALRRTWTEIEALKFVTDWSDIEGQFEKLQEQAFLRGLRTHEHS